MKAILEFDLPEDREEFETAQKGVDYMIVLSDLSNYLRSKIKYAEVSEEQHAVYEEIRSKLYEFAQDRNVEF